MDSYHETKQSQKSSAGSGERLISPYSGENHLSAIDENLRKDSYSWGEGPNVTKNGRESKNNKKEEWY